ncbi:MAG: hypothetical protein II630_03120 [Bacteroidales bacterium]|nr:hypothetical protein [Bacteroidales bacterium]
MKVYAVCREEDEYGYILAPVEMCGTIKKAKEVAKKYCPKSRFVKERKEGIIKYRIIPQNIISNDVYAILEYEVK